MKLAKAFERWGKRLLHVVVTRGVSLTPLAPESVDLLGIERILVVRQDSRLGNLVLMGPMLTALKGAFPAARIDVLISEGFEEVLAGNPNIDRIEILRKRRVRFIPWELPRFIMRIRRNRYDLAIDVSNGRTASFNNLALTALSGARYRLGYERDDAGGMLNVAIPQPPEGTYMPDALVGLVHRLAGTSGDFPLAYHLTREDRMFAEEWFREQGIGADDFLVVIHPGGKGLKRWPPARFAELIDRLGRACRPAIVLIGGAADEDALDTITRLIAAPAVVLTRVRVNRMAAVIERSSLFISGDTGPMHVAAALERPTIGIFITSDYHMYGPRGDRARIVIPRDGEVSCDDVMLAVRDLFPRVKRMTGAE